jgi:hypothetical protein
MLRIAVVSFVFGFLVVGLLLLCLAFGLATVAEARGWGSFGIGSGVLTILDYSRTPEGTETVIGTGTIVIALLAGLLNAIAGALVWSRTPRRRRMS